MTLRDLKIGDRFIHAKVKDKRTAEKFKVISKAQFNLSAGTATRQCVSERTRKAENKQCRLEVIKLPIYE